MHPHDTIADWNNPQLYLQLPDPVMLFLTGMVLYAPSYCILLAMPRLGDKKAD